MLGNVVTVTQKFLQDNSTTVLASIGVVGTVATAVLSAKAGYRAAHILDEEYKSQNLSPIFDEFSPREKIEILWKTYIPSAVVTTLTCSAILASVYVGNRRTAAIAAAYSLSEKAFSEYKEKVSQKLTKAEQRKVVDELGEERVRNNPVSEHSIIQGRGNVLCYEYYSGRYFMSDMESLRKANNDINHQILNNYHASLTDLYGLLGLDRTAVSDEVGWNSDQLLEMTYSTTLADDDRPCIVVNFNVSPIRGYYSMD